MKFSASALLISAALATIASAVPLVAQVQANANTHIIAKRCADCTHTDGVALDIIVKASADHYSSIAQTRLNTLMAEIETAKVTSGTQDLPQEKAMLNVAIQTKATVASDTSLDVAWSKKEEIEKKMVELDAMITKLILERIQANINAELL
ncbi:hypothetical protein BGX26_001396, partial [Mortierella sp. AD094]